MQILKKREYKFCGNGYMENHFYLEKSSLQICMILAKDRKHLIIGIMDGFEMSVTDNFWNKESISLHLMIREMRVLIKKLIEKRKRVVWEKYQDQNFKIGVLND